MKQIQKGVLAPLGFKGNGIASGIKEKGLDLGMIYSVVDANFAAVYTKNVVKAAPLLLGMETQKKNQKARAILINSGNANACTGLQGQENAKMMQVQTAHELDVEEDQVYVSSTGVIGVQLQADKIVDGVPKLAKKLGNTLEHSLDFATSIMTTDSKIKEVAFEVEVGNQTFTIGGTAKGSGMIHPNMGTMLSYVTTDVQIETTLLQSLLEETVNDTYNMISVDGDTSTNDTVMVMANGLSGIKVEENSIVYELFKEALFTVNEYLAKEIAKDGEGASKLIQVTVKEAKEKEKAAKIAKSIITSNLVKTAIFGCDANFGRILCAMGYSETEFDINSVSLYIESKNGCITTFLQGVPLQFNEEYAKNVLSEEEITITVFLKEGMESATAYGCDLTYDYIKINGEYRS